MLAILKVAYYDTTVAFKYIGLLPSIDLLHTLFVELQWQERGG